MKDGRTEEEGTQGQRADCHARRIPSEIGAQSLVRGDSNLALNVGAVFEPPRSRVCGDYARAGKSIDHDGRTRVRPWEEEAANEAGQVGHTAGSNLLILRFI